jgi:uncharacterized repeat protein (TIGR04052 family)
MDKVQNTSEENVLTELPISFVSAVNVLDCDSTLRIEEANWRINNLAFFISNLYVTTMEEGAENWQQVNFSQSQWQTEEVALVWYNTQCNQTKPTAANHNLKLQIDDQTWSDVKKVRFELSVPFELNHLNPLTQASPLNISDMFWSWRMGHKFLRLDLTQEANVSTNQNWSFHLGSLGCDSASSMRSPAVACKKPNRFTMELVRSDSHNNLVFDLAQLLNQVNPASMKSCMFERPGEESCPLLAENLTKKAVFYFE